jgi:plastocyanin
MRNMTKSGLAAIAAMVLVALGTVAAGRSDGVAADRHQPAHAADRETSTTVAIEGTSFRPGDITVSVNQTVEWINKDPFPHNVSSKAGEFRSGNLAPDGKWRFLPRNRGTFEYVCTLHPGMKARLHVK